MAWIWARVQIAVMFPENRNTFFFLSAAGDVQQATFKTEFY